MPKMFPVENPDSREVAIRLCSCHYCAQQFVVCQTHDKAVVHSFDLYNPCKLVPTYVGEPTGTKVCSACGEPNQIFETVDKPAPVVNDERHGFVIERKQALIPLVEPERHIYDTSTGGGWRNVSIHVRECHCCGQTFVVCKAKNGKICVHAFEVTDLCMLGVVHDGELSDTITCSACGAQNDVNC